MHLVQIGYRTVNLEYLIEAADSELGAPPDEAPPGQIRVSVYPGKIFDVGGEAADKLRIHLKENVKSLPPDKPAKTGSQADVIRRPPKSSRDGTSKSPGGTPRKE